MKATLGRTGRCRACVESTTLRNHCSFSRAAKATREKRGCPRAQATGTSWASGGAFPSGSHRVWKAAKQGLAGMPQQCPGWILLSGNISLQRQKDEASKWRGSGILDSSKTGSGAVLRKDGKTCEIPATQSPGSHGAPGFEIYFMGYKWVSPAPKTACKVAESIAESSKTLGWLSQWWLSKATDGNREPALFHVFKRHLEEEEKN